MKKNLFFVEHNFHAQRDGLDRVMFKKDGKKKISDETIFVIYY